MAYRGCEKPIVHTELRSNGFDGLDIMMKCGDNFKLEMRLCDSCMTFAQEHFPQGWKSYPGDICPHRVYVGGSGPDNMCGTCEGWG